MKWSSYHHGQTMGISCLFLSTWSLSPLLCFHLRRSIMIIWQGWAGPQAFQHGEVSWNHQLLDTRKIQKVWKSFESFKHLHTSSKPKVLSSLGFLRGPVTSSGHAWPASSLVSGTGGWDCWARRCNTVLSMLWKRKTVWCILDRPKKTVDAEK